MEKESVITCFDSSRETLPYRQQPKAMPVGAVGKRGHLRLVFERTNDGREVLRTLQRKVPLIVQRALYFDEEWPELPCVYILSSGGPYVDGDRYEMEIQVKRGGSAFLSTGAATKIAEMRYNYAALRQRIILEEGAYLEVLPEPTIPCRHSRFISETLLEVAPSATLCFAEIFSGGRKHFQQGEHFDYDLLSVTTVGERPDGSLLFHDKFVISPGEDNPSALGVMHHYEVFAHVIVLTQPEEADKLYDRTRPFLDTVRGLAAAISRLPNRCGLIYKVLGMENEPVKQRVRQFCSAVRETVKGRPIPDEFTWR